MPVSGILFILANGNCRIHFIAAVYAVNLSSCLRQSLSLTGIKKEVVSKPDTGYIYRGRILCP